LDKAGWEMSSDAAASVMLPKRAAARKS
jgi:hypothetical protein